MARASLPTLLPLDRYFAILGVDPLHANQLYSSLRPLSHACDDLWLQYDWQDVGRISRETIAIAIEQAEQQIAEFLGYQPRPRWETHEWHRTTPPARPELVNTTGLNIRWYRKSISLRWGHIISGGVETKDLIEAGATIVYSDSDGDGYKETATITTTVASGRDPCEIAVYYPGKSAADEWEIRPADISVSGTTATIVLKRHQLVDEDLLETLSESNQAVDADIDANFLSTIDIYRHYNDPSDQALLVWERPDYSSIATQTAFLGMRDCRKGIVTYTPGTWDATDEEFDVEELNRSRDPDRIRVSYYAGYRDRRLACPTNTMNSVFEFLVARYATTLLDGELCGCENFRKQVDYWRDDTAEIKRDRSYSTTPRLLENPFGTTRAGIYVWRTLNKHDFQIGQAALV